MSGERTYDHDEVDQILRTAASADRPEPTALIRHGDGLTLAEIQQVSAQAGIDGDAVASASVALALNARLGESHRLHFEQLFHDPLNAAALDRIAETIRARMHGVDVRRSENALEFEVTRKDGELGRLLVNLRTRDDVTTLSVWSDAPHFTAPELAISGIFGMPVALFPSVAMAGGQWPTIGVVAGLAAVGAAAGTGAALAWQRWAAARWRSRVLAVVSPIVASVAELTLLASDTSGGRAVPRR